MTASVLKLPSEQIVRTACAMARANGEDPEGFLDYSDLRAGKYRWEYFEDAAREQVREQTLALLTHQVQQCAFTPEEIVRATVDILESRA